MIPSKIPSHTIQEPLQQYKKSLPTIQHGGNVTPDIAKHTGRIQKKNKRFLSNFSDDATSSATLYKNDSEYRAERDPWSVAKNHTEATTPSVGFPLKCIAAGGVTVQFRQKKRTDVSTKCIFFTPQKLPARNMQYYSRVPRIGHTPRLLQGWAGLTQTKSDSLETTTWNTPMHKSSHAQMVNIITSNTGLVTSGTRAWPAVVVVVVEHPS